MDFQRLWETVMICLTSEAICKTVGSMMSRSLKAEHFSMVWQCSVGLSSLGMKSPSTHHNIFSTKRVLSLVRAPQCAIAFSCVLGQKQKHET